MSAINKLEPHFEKDVHSISRIGAVSSILEVICSSTGMGFAAVARVTEDRWIACAVRDEITFGLEPGGELEVETTICHEIRQSKKAVVIDDVIEDDKYCNHHTPAMYGFRSYISVPITLKNGQFFGTLCAIDPKPAHLNNNGTRKMFSLFAELIAFHLHAIEELSTSEMSLIEERSKAELQDQFIAILGHDLRNPVGASLGSAQLLLQMPLDEQALRLANVVLNSSYRIKGLIDNILDFASGRLGRGIVLTLNDDEEMDKVLDEVISELKIVWPDRRIETKYNFDSSVHCDNNRVAQLFSNLLSNALTYGSNHDAVRVEAVSKKGDFILSVCNSGNKIPDVVLQHLFQPFYRGKASSNQKGLGLGLYISRQIAIAHGGTLEVMSDDDQTCFTLRIPCRK